MDEKNQNEYVPRTTADLQKIEIEPEEIVYLVQELAKDHEAGYDGDFYSAVRILHERYQDDIERTFCITERLRCLIELMKSPRMRGWAFQSTQPDGVFTNGAVFHATAKCTLRGEDRAYFEPDEFFDWVLKESDSAGNA